MDLDLPRCSTAGEWLAKAAVHLATKGVPEAQANAELLLGHVLGLPRLETRARGSRALSAKEGLRYWSMVIERSKRVPLAYILGFQEFMGLRFKVRPCVLIPRPETEQLVEAILQASAAHASASSDPPGAVPGLHILEIGAGSGCVSVALAVKLPSAVVYATDISKSALDLAEENARAHGVSSRVRFLREDLFKPVSAAAPRTSEAALPRVIPRSGAAATFAAPCARGEMPRSGDGCPMAAAAARLGATRPAATS
mgnify:CR=1 FL=1